MTISNSRKQERTQLLSEYYAEVFSSYLVFFSDESTDNLVRFLSSAEKARLLCSAASDKLLKELEGIVVMTDPPLRECKELVDALRLSAKKDVVKG